MEKEYKEKERLKKNRIEQVRIDKKTLEQADLDIDDLIEKYNPLPMGKTLWALKFTNKSYLNKNGIFMCMITGQINNYYKCKIGDIVLLLSTNQKLDNFQALKFIGKFINLKYFTTRFGGYNVYIIKYLAKYVD